MTWFIISAWRIQFEHVRGRDGQRGVKGGGPGPPPKTNHVRRRKEGRKKEKRGKKEGKERGKREKGEEKRGEKEEKKRRKDKLKQKETPQQIMCA